MRQPRHPTPQILHEYVAVRLQRHLTLGTGVSQTNLQQTLHVGRPSQPPGGTEMIQCNEHLLMLARDLEPRDLQGGLVA